MSTEPLTLCKLFARCVRRTPDNLAVDHEHGCLTYNELDAASSRVANNLAKLGVKHGSPVLLFTAPGTLNVVAVLGILKIGASFVPIDRRTWSTDKVRYVMEMVDSSAIVNTTGESFPATSNHRILDLREVPKGLVDEAEAPIGRQVMPEDVACIIFTSGSTGRPKGVLLTHDSISLYAQTSLFNMDVRPGDRVLHILSVAFDGKPLAVSAIHCALVLIPFSMYLSIHLRVFLGARKQRYARARLDGKHVRQGGNMHHHRINALVISNAPSTFGYREELPLGSHRYTRR